MGEGLLLADLGFVQDVEVVGPFALLNRLGLTLGFLAVFKVADVETFVFLVGCPVRDLALLVALHLGHHMLHVLVVELRVRLVVGDVLATLLEHWVAVLVNKAF